MDKVADKPAKKRKRIVKRPKRTDKLNPREARAVALLKSGEAKTQKAALEGAGYSASTAEKAAKSVLGKVRVQSALMDAFNELGVNDTYLARRHKTLIDSKEHQAVSKGLDMAYKVRGEYAPEKHEHSVDVVEKVSESKLIEVLRKVAEEAKAKAKKGESADES